MLFKRIFSIILISFLVSIPIAANGDVLWSVYPHFAMPVGKDTHGINYGIGAGTKILYRPIKYFEAGIYGDYLNLNIPSISPISVFDVGLTAGYILPLNDRLGLNFDLEAGLFKATQNKSYSSVEIGASLSLSYRIRPSIYAGASTSFSHYSGGRSALLNGVMFSPGVTFNLSEAFNRNTQLKMETQDILPVFPVLYSWYERNRFATIRITNEEDKTIENVKVSFYQPQYMGHPNVCAGSDEKIRLRSGESVDIDLTAFFNERMLEMTEKSDTQAIVTVEYTYMGEKRSQEFAMIIPVYGRNSMSWADDRRAAVFVSSKDPAAMLYSKYVTSIIRENLRIGVPQNIQYALGIFNSLAEFGINYVIDPSSAYTDNVGTETPDFLQFPYQTLSYRGGDCDDLSILMCSLLEAVNVDTAFITIPGHIYMAFNLGLDINKAKEQFGSLDNFIVFDEDNEVWVPLEITVTDEGFNRAWQIGAREWRTADRDGTAAIYRMKDSWQIYKPVSVPGAEVTFTMPEKETLASTFANGVDSWILREIEDKVNTYKKYIARTGDIKAQNTLGAIYGRYGLFNLADEQLSNPVKQGYIPAMLNAANVQFAKKNFVEAEQMYKNVIRRDRKNALAYLGVARCCFEQENFDECDLAYTMASQLDSKAVSSYPYLGSFENTSGRAYNLADRLSYTIWQTDEIDLEDIIIDEAVEKKVEELKEFYGELANSLIEKTKANAQRLPKFTSITEFPLKRDDDEAGVVYTGLSRQIAILPPDDKILAALKVADEIDLPEVPRRDSEPEQIKRVKIELAPTKNELVIADLPKLPTVYEAPQVPAVVEPVQVPMVAEIAQVPAVVEPAQVPMVAEIAQVPAVVEPVQVPMVAEIAQVPAVVEPMQVPMVAEIAQVPAVVESVQVPMIVESAQVPLVIEPMVAEIAQVPAVVETPVPPVSEAVVESVAVFEETAPVAEEIPVSHEIALAEDVFPSVDALELVVPSEEENFPSVAEIALILPPVPETQVPPASEEPVFPPSEIVEKTDMPSAQSELSSINWILPVCIAGGFGLLAAVIILAVSKSKKDEERGKHDENTV